MSAGAVFKLIANDGKADRMIMATKLLSQRISDVMCARRSAGKVDITPTLVDLERTHILYVNAHFKPFAAIGYEYNKVRPQSGSAQLGGGVTFSIPQFGDFFHDMVCRTRLSSFMGNAGLTPVQGGASFPANTTVAVVVTAAYTAALAIARANAASTAIIVDALSDLTPTTANVVALNLAPVWGAAVLAYLSINLAAVPTALDYATLVAAATAAFGILPAATVAAFVYTQAKQVYAALAAPTAAETATYNAALAVYATTAGDPADATTIYAAALVAANSALKIYQALLADASTITTYNIVDACGNRIVAGADVANAAVSYRNFVRYCEYPGNRLFRLVKFDVNGNPLDQYDEMIPTMLEKFCTPPGKRTGHDRLVGQEVPLTGYSGICCAVVTDPDSASTPAKINKSTAGQSNQTVGLFDDGTVGLSSLSVLNQLVTTDLNAAGSAQIDVSRKLQQVVNGPQTPKPVQAPLELWNKIRFWFNDDVRLSIASVSIPFGQRYISIELNQQSLLAYEYPSIHLEKVVSVGASMTKTYSPIFQKFGTTEITIPTMELYINNIFVNSDVHDIYIKRIGFSLIRVYRQHTQRCNQESTDEKLLSQLKWPIEYMFVGIRPVWNIKDIVVGAGGLVTGGNQNQWRDWHRLTRVLEAKCDDVTRSAVPSGDTSAISQIIPDHYYLPVPTVDSMSLTTHGIVIFDSFNDTFFNQYMPFHYGGTALVTPEDPGALFVNMALFPRSYQPSGHLNISRARETYLKWTSSYVSAASPADLIAVGVAINFLLITDGSAVLRYST